jgi:ribosomal protein S18 acetylase RimI-like enzyme
MENKGRPMKIRTATADDAVAIFNLYRHVAAIPGGLARLEGEITLEYVNNFLCRSLANGLVLVAEDADGYIIGEIHVYSPGIFCFSHVLSELTIAIDPTRQGNGIGRQLFQSLLGRVIDERPDIMRVELIARESNKKALRFYKSLGFVPEGRLAGRIKNVNGSLECDIPMAWHSSSTGHNYQSVSMS